MSDLRPHIALLAEKLHGLYNRINRLELVFAHVVENTVFMVAAPGWTIERLSRRIGEIIERFLVINIKHNHELPFYLPIKDVTIAPLTNANMWRGADCFVVEFGVNTWSDGVKRGVEQWVDMLAQFMHTPELSVRWVPPEVEGLDVVSAFKRLSAETDVWLKGDVSYSKVSWCTVEVVCGPRRVVHTPVPDGLSM